MTRSVKKSSLQNEINSKLKHSLQSLHPYQMRSIPHNHQYTWPGSNYSLLTTLDNPLQSGIILVSYTSQNKNNSFLHFIND